MANRTVQRKGGWHGGPVKNIKLSWAQKVDRPTLVMLNAITPYLYRDNPHQTARMLLRQKCEEVVRELGIDLSNTQSAMAG